jgi:flagellar basal-body rod modification protein FlgD
MMASALAMVQAHTQPNPMSSTADSSGTSSTDGATISANDFLTLLVTEMKNQDPTAQTDPNEYINQLVGVNSLEQLIQINQNLSTALGSGSASGQAVSAPQSPAAVAASQVQTNAAPSTDGGGSTTWLPAGLAKTAGNLGVPQAMPAAQRVAQALSGR